MARRYKPHRGVVLLVVLTLLTLLIVVGLTFTVLSGQFRRAAEASASKERYDDGGQQLADRALYQLVRDTPGNARSSLKGHSLLRDLLGNDGVAGVVQTWNPAVQGEFLNINFTPSAAQPFGNAFNTQAGYYNGCTLTILGPVYTVGADNQAGRAGVNDDGANGTDDPGELGWPGTDDLSLIADSVRIVRYNYDPTSSTGSIMVEWSDGEGGRKGFPRPNTRFLVNGRAVNGTGAGYLNSSQYTLDAKVDFPSRPPLLPTPLELDVALLPNYNTYAASAGVIPNLGGLDEPWDAVDYQNMYLAMVPADVSLGIIPSFHRPELVNYWLKRFANDYLAQKGITDTQNQIKVFRCALPEGLDGVVGNHPVTGLNDDPVDDSGDPIPGAVLQQIIEFKRMIFLRPLPEDHPNFVNREWFGRTIGLPDQSLGQTLPQMVWDVDNDGDGVPDSIWLDIGLPLQTDASGRRFRPLVAILCEDLDGRLNVNAHSSPAQNSNLYALGRILQPTPANATAAPFATTPLDAANPLHSVLLPRGLGVGPADIFLGHLFGSADFRNVLTERYRHDVTVTGNAGGISNVDDMMSQVKNLGLPRDYNSIYSAYGSPPDVWGRGAIGLDYSGQPMAFYMGEAGETVGDPYEQVLNRQAAGYTDAPFSVAELERVLRYYDRDALGLPNRLLNAGLSAFGGNGSPARENRRLVTTHSAHLPVINATVPAQRRATMAASTTSSSHSILELYALKMQRGGVPAAQIQTELLKIVPWEIWHGERFNVNRLLGNGRDDNGNNVVDEPAEAFAGEVVWPDLNPDIPGGFDGGSSPIPFNYRNDDQLITNDRYAPQIYARHLYCLMMMLTEVLGPGGYLHPTEESLPLAYRQELTANRVAQWAINVVDFRDADAIMTPFEYDMNPFNANGWQAMDGDPATHEGGDRRLTWGAEYPDLLLTETGAFHDRRVKDTKDHGERKMDDTDPDYDEDLDQYRIPQGSLFLELYCTRNHVTNNTRLPAELYNENGSLDLGRLAPADASGFRAPVWQVMISQALDPEPATHADEADSPLERSERRILPSGPPVFSKPDSTSFNPVPQINPTTGAPDLTYSYNMDLVTSLMGARPANPRFDRLVPERYVWFAPQPPPTSGGGLATYYCQNYRLRRDRGNNVPQESDLLLAPGSYAVVGPREFTRVGASDDADSATDFDLSPQSIIMRGRTFRTINNDGSDTYTPLLGPPAPIRNPVGIICAAYPPNDWTNGALRSAGIGLSVSEPLPQDNYYEEPEPDFVFDPDYGLPDAYAEPELIRTDPAVQFPDEPFDNIRGRPLAVSREYQNLQHTHTTEDYKAAFLQRLANPLEEFHVTRNPYVTVDWSTIDLTVFNGEDVREKSGFDPFDPQDDPADDPSENEVRFATRQRGGRATFSGNPPYYTPFIATTPDYQIWSSDTQPPFETQEVPNPVTVGSLTLRHYFQHNFVHSLGYLNGTMGAPMPANIVSAGPTYLGVPVYLGAPQQPFPWLAWNNRPFANPLELMQVPSSTPSRLLHEFEVYRDTSGTVRATNDAYDSETFNVAASPSSSTDLQHFRGTFRHLLNFFHTSKTSSTDVGANFYRILECVETPSPFVGAEKWYNPLATADPSDLGAALFRPPYNNLSRFQDPGRVNINTILDARIWEGIAKGYPAMDPTSIGMPMYTRILQSRRGYAGNPWELNSDYPTLFGNPFRSADSADLMPRNVPSTPNPPNFPTLRKNEPVQASLLREDLLTPRTDALFVPPGGPGSEPALAYQNQDRNSYFRYHGLARLSNLVSNNSNVFAVWITVGYFEVEPNPFGVDAAHPDGFRLGPELGTDSGTVKRHRAFYMIDRSVPVAFEPGQNHNVDNAILLRRFLE